jgi:HEAT repeat protein
MMKSIARPETKFARRRRAVLFAGLLFAFVLMTSALLRPREPMRRGKPASAWVAELGDNSYAAVRALREIGPGAIVPLIRALEKKPAGWLHALAFARDHAPWFAKPKLGSFYASAARIESRIPWMRAAAAQVLGDFGSDARSATPALLKALTDSDATLRVNAAFALGKIGANPQLVVPALAALLRDGNEEVRAYAAIALKKYGVQATMAVPGLITALQDRSWRVRERAALALGALEGSREDVVSALEKALRDEHRFVRSSAATALAALAPRTKSARAALEQARYDPDAEVRYSAGLAVTRIDSEWEPSAP